MDKDNTHIESEFVDHSWQEMSKLLDQEMPVKKPKRRIFWIFFFGISLLGIIGLAYYTIGYSTDKEPALKSFAIQKDAKVATTKPQSDNNSQSSIDSKKVSVKRAPAKSPDDIRLISTHTVITKIHPTAKKISTAVGTGPTIANNKVQHSIPLKDKEGFLSAKNVTRAANKFQTELPIIATLPLNMLPANHNHLLDLDLTFPIVKKKSSKWRFGFYAGALAPKLGSFRTGLFTNVNLNKKWAIHFGLGYAKRIATSINKADNTLNATMADIFESEMEDEMNPLGSSPTPIPSNNPSNELDLISSMSITYSDFHYFEIPLLVRYHIRPKLGVEIGGNLSYLHGYHYQYDNATFFSKDANMATAFDTRSANSFNANLATIPTMNVGLMGGINYQVTRKLNAYTTYHYSNAYLTTTPPATLSKKRWQQIEVGIRYYFK